MDNAFLKNQDAVVSLMNGVAVRPNRFQEIDKLMLVCKDFNVAGLRMKKEKIWNDLQREDRNALVWNLMKSERICRTWERTSWPGLIRRCEALHRHLDFYEIPRDKLSLPTIAGAPHPTCPKVAILTSEERESYETYFTNEILNIISFLKNDTPASTHVDVNNAAFKILFKIRNLIPWITTPQVRLELVHVLVRKLQNFLGSNLYKSKIVRLVFRAMDSLLTRVFLDENVQQGTIDSDPMFKTLDSIIFNSIKSRHAAFSPNRPREPDHLIESLFCLVSRQMVNTETFITHVLGTMMTRPQYTHNLAWLLVLYASTPERHQEIMRTTITGRTIVDVVLSKMLTDDEGYNSLTLSNHYIDLFCKLLEPMGANIMPKQKIQILNFCVYTLMYALEPRAIVTAPSRALLRLNVVVLMQRLLYSTSIQTKSVLELMDEIHSMPIVDADIIIQPDSIKLIIGSVYRAPQNISVLNTVRILDRWLDISDEKKLCFSRTHAIEVLVNVSSEDMDNHEIIRRILKYMAIPMYHGLISHRDVLSLHFMSKVSKLQHCTVAELLGALEKFEGCDNLVNRHMAHDILCLKYKEMYHEDFASDKSIWKRMRRNN